MNKIITFAAWKGGVGKTTLIYNLTVLANKKKILLVDIDSQCNLTNALVKDYENDILHNPKPLKTNYDHIDLIASNMALSSKNCIVDYEKLVEKYKNEYDYIVFDTPPNLNSEIIKTFKCSDEVYLITDGSSMSYTGLLTTLEQYELYCRNNQVKENIKGIILNNLNRFKLTEEFINVLKKNPKTKELVMMPHIYKKSSIYKTLIFKKSIKEMKDYQTFAKVDELSRKIFG